jgi:dienelactone hydrolase
LLRIHRKLADKIGAAGYFVVIPDYFSGDVLIPGVTDRDEWFKKHNPVSTQTL